MVILGRANRKTAGNYNASSYKVGVVTDIEIKDDGSTARFFKSCENKNMAGLDTQPGVISEESMVLPPTQPKKNNTYELSIASLNNNVNNYKSFLYCPKASKSERDRGCERMETKDITHGLHSTSYIGDKEYETKTVGKNNHPTVKPIALMKYLIQMITPEGGVVLDPFAGSGSTLVAAKELGYDFIGIEMTEEYIPIIESRLNAVKDTLWIS
jgi:hypothetical protein